MSDANATATSPRAMLERLKANPRLPLIIAVAAVAAILVALLLWARSPDYRVLFSNLSNADGGTIVSRLEQMQVPYRLTSGGQAIMVPADRVDQVRLSLASEGLPKGGGVGFELMDNQSFGVSQFVEHVNYQRALEGELARSIESIDAVSSARVHLAMPQESVFVRDRKQPTASVILPLYQGRAMADGQVSAIAHLVSSSVSNLPVDAVTVVDQNGRLLSRAGAGDGRGLDDTQLEYTARIEQNLRNRIETILAPVVGRENVRAQVTASLDFSRAEHTREQYTPNQDPAQAAIRSKQVSESNQLGGSGIGGVPGALSNQPTPQAPSPIQNPDNGNNQGDDDQGNNQNDNNGGDANGTAGQRGTPRSSNHSSTINYELDRTIRHVQEESGRVQRLSVGVVVDYRNQVGDDGEISRVPLSDEQMAQIQRLVREAVGYSQQRGDSVEVVNAEFSEQMLSEPPAPAWWQNPQLISLAMTVGRYLLIALVAFILWRKLIKPLLDRQREAAPAPAATGTSSTGSFAAVAGDDEEFEGSAEEEEAEFNRNMAEQARKRQRKVYDNQLAEAQERAKDDPRMVAMILRGWMNGKD
ncbi:flagellar M-ring protein FliF [Kushneria sinocarnis]|uniref:Flagellar M-ring protein n=1 Tax=Kushneria sinocarnis TaxID=595502 RepID=A0A420WY37_9GAMM|nr:flagellar basal-body MS-ring/collar protein FliF [Kushneria sinocarnis]RKR06103.1 flagellar M-ring protein FliF [Kushneria sinocarnis]